MKDYYKILGISPDATEEEIKRAYRRLALRYHPDRNPEDPHAEERFKEITEAYGVLIDPLKRAEFDRIRASYESEGRWQTEFSYSKDKIFEDILRDARFNSIFNELLREFERAGLRYDKAFFDNLFFGGRGIFFGGVFIWGPFGFRKIKDFQPLKRRDTSNRELKKDIGIIKKLKDRISRFLAGPSISLPKDGIQKDIVYNIRLKEEELRKGTWINIRIDRGTGEETLRVRIPPNTKEGTKLRIRGKGHIKNGRSGDLYLRIGILR